MTNVLQHYLNEHTLNQTMELFWRKGYLAVSISEIVEITGLHRAAIYNYFGGKESLYIAMLKRYLNQVTVDLLAPLTSSDHPLEAIKNFFCQFLSTHKWPLINQYGCMMITEASQLPFESLELKSLINQFFDELHQSFLSVLKQAQHQGLCSKHCHPQQSASFFVANTVGLLTLIRINTQQQWLSHQIMQINYYLDQITKES